MGTSLCSEVLFISFSCIIKIDQKFFLLVEIESNIPCIDFDEVVIFKITKTQAEHFIAAGIELCRILDEIPTSTKAEFVCVFIQDERAFLIFDLETEPEEVVLVRTTLEDAKRRLQHGQHLCRVIDC